MFNRAKTMPDKARTKAYAKVLSQAIKPGTVVAEIGARTGILALLSCLYGARRVYASYSTSAIELARRTAAANGLTERLQFIHADSAQPSLPEPADLIVTDLHDVFPVARECLRVIIDAATAWPSGVIPLLRKRFTFPTLPGPSNKAAASFFSRGRPPCHSALAMP